MINAILFDFFDVIRQDAFQAWMRNHNFTRDDPAGSVSRRLDTGVIDQKQFVVELAELSNQTVDHVNAEFKQNEKFDHAVIEFIKSLKGTYKLGLVSNAASGYLRGILAAEKLDTLFDMILISSEVGVAKPDKDFFDLALQKLDVAAEEVIFVDDSEKNIAGAEVIGIKGVVFKDCNQLRVELGALLNG